MFLTDKNLSEVFKKSLVNKRRAHKHEGSMLALFHLTPSIRMGKLMDALDIFDLTIIKTNHRANYGIRLINNKIKSVESEAAWIEVHVSSYS